MPEGSEPLEHADDSDEEDTAGRLDDIHPELRYRDQHICWKAVNGVKTPRTVDDRRNASTADRTTWSAFESAARAVREAAPGTFDGIGFVFTPDDPYIGFDFDNCLDEHGHAVDWARPWLERFRGCYIEVSPSGRGLHVYCRGTIPKGGKVWDGPGEHCGIEAYDRGRYFCVTGRIWGGSPDDVIPDRQDVIDDLFAWAAAQEPTRTRARLTPEKSAGSRWKRKVAHDEEPTIAFGSAALAAETAKMASTGQGSRNNQLFASACALFELVNAGTLGRDQAESGLRDAARTAGLDDQEIDGRFRSAWKKVGEKARDLSHVGTKAKERGKAAEIIDEATGLVETVDNEHRLARAVLKAKFHHPDRPTLCFWMGEWYVWRHGEWKAIPDKEINAAVTEVVRSEFEAHAKSNETAVKSVSTRLTGNVTAALRGLVLLPEREYPSQPMWLFGGGPDPAECVNFRNGVLHLPTLVDVGPETALTPPTPRFFAASALRYDFDLKSPRPAGWLDFLDTVWDDDPESIEALQQWFGYLLTMDTSRQKALMIEGPTRSGKGTIARVLTALVGPDNVTAPTLTSLGQHFGLQSLIGRSIAFCNESRLSARSDAPAIVERVLSISGEDEQSISRKHTTDWKGKLGVRFVFSTNEMPRLTDAAGALLTRFIFLKLTRSFVGREDRELGRKLVAEAPGILLWAIKGWANLRESGSFVQPQSAVSAMTEWQELINPLGGFVAERCLIGPDLLDLYGQPAMTETKTLYRAWVEWCQENGREPKDSAWFGQKLKTAYPYIDRPRRRDPGLGGRRDYYYTNIRLL